MGAEAEVFPAWTEADWRKAAENALKGASLDKLVTRTADGLRVEPVYQPGDGPRALRAGGPWRVIARLDHPDAREANAQALEDLAGGADGLQVVFTGAIGSYGFGLKRSDPETLVWRSTIFSSTPEPGSSSTSGRTVRPRRWPSPTIFGTRARSPRSAPYRSVSIPSPPRRMDPFRPAGPVTSSLMSTPLSN